MDRYDDPSHHEYSSDIDITNEEEKKKKKIVLSKFLK